MTQPSRASEEAVELVAAVSAGMEHAMKTNEHGPWMEAKANLLDYIASLEARAGEPVAWTIADSAEDVRPLGSDEHLDDHVEWDPEQAGTVSRREGRAESWASAFEKVVVPLYRHPHPDRGEVVAEARRAAVNVLTRLGVHPDEAEGMVDDELRPTHPDTSRTEPEGDAQHG